jgi:hypothetical protein
MGTHHKTIRVLSDDAANATREAASLRRHLLDGFPEELAVDLVREDQSAQDMGATLLVLLAAPATMAVAQGIAEWLRMRRAQPTLEIEVNGQRIRASGRIAEDAQSIAALVAALQMTSPDAQAPDETVTTAPRWPPRRVNALAKTLAKLFPREPDQRAFVTELELPEHEIAFDSKASVAWVNIVGYASRQARLEAMLDLALEKYPAYEELLAVRDYGEN